MRVILSGARLPCACASVSVAILVQREAHLVLSCQKCHAETSLPFAQLEWSVTADDLVTKPPAPEPPRIVAATELPRKRRR